MKAYVMVGAPGSGKSTEAERIARAENATIISGDDIRRKLYGSSEVKGNWVEIHDRIEELVSESCGMPVILDGTHYLASYRREAIALLRSYGYDDITAVVVNPSLATCLARNFQRTHHVPDYVIKSTHEKLQSSLHTLEIEGFNNVRYHENKPLPVFV